MLIQFICVILHAEFHNECIFRGFLQSFVVFSR